MTCSPRSPPPLLLALFLASPCQSPALQTQAAEKALPSRSQLQLGGHAHRSRAVLQTPTKDPLLGCPWSRSQREKLPALPSWGIWEPGSISRSPPSGTLDSANRLGPREGCERPPGLTPPESSGPSLPLSWGWTEVR